MPTPKARRRAQGTHEAEADADPAADSGNEETDSWREELLGALLAMDPGAFEHLAGRLLRAEGFINTAVTGGSGDGGIDGVGVYRLSLVSFPAYFQERGHPRWRTSDRLIDGERLCDLLKKNELGVETKQRTVEDVEVHADFFQKFGDEPGVS